LDGDWPHKLPGSTRGPIVTFDHFIYFGANGPPLLEYAPTLAAHMYGLNVRTLMGFTDAERTEVHRILELVKSAPPSPALRAPRRAGAPADGRRRC
jgi:hypothetical protein